MWLLQCYSDMSFNFPCPRLVNMRSVTTFLVPKGCQVNSLIFDYGLLACPTLVDSEGFPELLFPVPYSTSKLVDAPPPFNSTANLTNDWEKSCNPLCYHLQSKIDAISEVTDRLWSLISDNGHNLTGIYSS